MSAEHKRTIVGFEPLPKKLQESDVTVVKREVIMGKIVSGVTGPFKEPVYDKDGKLIGHSLVTEDLAGVTLPMTRLTFSDGGTALI